MAFAIFSNPKCLSGSEWGLMISGMSKFARRKNAEMSFWCSVDLYLSGFQSVYTPNEKKTRENYRSRFVNRFPVALIEDSMPKCWWVLRHIKKFTELCLKSYADNKVDIEVIKIIHFLIFNISNQEKCRTLQHLREVGDEEFKSIENVKSSHAEKVFLDILKKYNGYDQNIIDSCLSVYRMRKKPFILSAALSYVRYHHIFEEPSKSKYKNSFNKTLKMYVDDPVPEWKNYPFLFDKHVSSTIARKYGVAPIKGWKGFVENEEQVCWDNACKEMKDSFVFNELKNKYWEKRLSQ